MGLSVSEYPPSLLTRPRIQSVCAVVVVVGSLLPWTRVPAGVFNFMYFPGLESGLAAYGRYTLIAGVGAFAFGWQSAGTRGIRIASIGVAGLVVVLSLAWIVRMMNVSGFSPAIGAFLTLLGGISLLTVAFTLNK